jgi:hypothetical protein
MAPDTRRVSRFVTVGCLLALAVLVMVLFVGAANKNTEDTLLQRVGVPVTVTVSGCVGNRSVTGHPADGFTCRGSFALHGQRHQDAIEGLSQSRPLGVTVRGIVDPSDPNILGWFPAVQRTPSAMSSFVALAVLLGVLVLLVPLAVWRARRANRHDPARPDAVGLRSPKPN